MTDTPDATMLPCPFCGGETYQHRHFWEVVTCRDCAADGPAKETPAEAIAAWNTRAGQALERAEIVAKLREPGLMDALAHIARKAQGCADSYRNVPVLAEEVVKIERSLEAVYAHMRLIETGEL